MLLELGMGASSARFFGLVQSADFYREVLREAVDLMPMGSGQPWLDVGSGPGLVARLAQERGYDAVGFEATSKWSGSPAASRGAARPRFDETRLCDLVAGHGRAEVVSAASLLGVLKDRRAAMLQLLDAVAPRGYRRNDLSKRRQCNVAQTWTALP